MRMKNTARGNSAPLAYPPGIVPVAPMPVTKGEAMGITGNAPLFL